MQKRIIIISKHDAVTCADVLQTVWKYETAHTSDNISKTVREVCEVVKKFQDRKERSLSTLSFKNWMSA